MPAARAASSREDPSSTRAKASIRREAAVSRHRLASRRRSPAPSSFRVIATVMAPPPTGTPPINRVGRHKAPSAMTRQQFGPSGIR